MFLELYGSVKIFTGQGVEKNNDVARSIVLRKSNKWDLACDVLRHEKRQWELQDCERRPRGYTPQIICIGKVGSDKAGKKENVLVSK